MKRSLPRAGLNRSRLLHLLADPAIEGTAGPKQSFAERLGDWLTLGDAIALSGALGTGAGTPPADAAQASAGDIDARRKAARELAQAFARTRAALADSIAADGVSETERGAERARVKSLFPPPGASIDGAGDYLPYRRFHLALQREMETGIGQLRAGVRQALARHSPGLRRLAAIDAALGKALAERERDLLASVPHRLEKRFAQLYETHRQALAATRQADTPADTPDTPEHWLQAGGWLAEFRSELRAVLLAELDLRLQPVAGLIDAFSNEVTSSQ